MRKKLNFCSHLKDARTVNTFPAKCPHLVGPKLFSKGNKPAAFLFKLARKFSAACTVHQAARSETTLEQIAGARLQRVLL